MRSRPSAQEQVKESDITADGSAARGARIQAQEEVARTPSPVKAAAPPESIAAARR
jgi:hypothetical protein